MNSFFKSKKVITLNIFILSCLLCSLVYQFFFVESPTKRLRSAVSNSDFAYYNSSISDTICDLTIQHSLHYYIFSGYKGGCQFEEDEVIHLIDSFVVKNETIMKKRKNDSVIRFINKKDTLVVNFEVYKKNGVLFNGEIR